MVIREKTRAGQENGRRACGGCEAWLVAGRAEPVLADVLGGPAAGWPPQLRPQPEQAKTSESTPPTKAPPT
jgi:hypothetical protein